MLSRFIPCFSITLSPYIFLRFLLVTFGGAAFIQIAGSFSLFYFGEFTDLVCAILYAAAIFTCILTGKSRPSSSKGDPSAEK